MKGTLKSLNLTINYLRKNNTIRLSHLYFLVLTALFFGSCHKDVDESKIVDTRIPGPDIVEQFDGNLTVLLTDLVGNPIPDADIFVYDNSKISDKEGIAVFKNIPLDKTGTHVKALKQGYLFGSMTFNPSGADNYIIVKMLPIQNMATINSNDNVSVAIPGGGEILIESGVFEYENGTKYEGEVSILSQHYNTTEATYGQSIPGDHTGLALNGSTKALEMHSTIAVYAYDVEGLSLFIGEDKSLEISMPVDETKFDLVPETIKAWNYDELAASWLEKETAYKDYGRYLLEVKSLGYWACAKSKNFKNLEGRLLSNTGKGLSHLTVTVKNEFTVASALTDGEGGFYTKVPEGTEMTIELSHPACDVPLYTGTIEALVNDFQLDDIIINTDNVQDIIGYINCNTEPISNGVVYCKTDYYTYVLEADENGLFNIFLAEAICNPVLSIDVFGLDPENENESITNSFDYNAVNDVYLDVCADCAFQINVDDEILDYCDLLVELTVTADLGSGDYSYKWEDGSAGQSVTVTENQEFCLTVTDNVTNCIVTGCKSFVAPDALTSNFELIEMIDCESFGAIGVNTLGGKLPYTFSWNGPNGYTSTEPFISNLEASGSYTYTVTDGNLCTNEGVQFIEDLSGTFDLDVFTEDLNNVICDENDKIVGLNCGGCGIDLSNALWELPDGSFQNGQEINAEQPGIYHVTVNSLNCYAEGSIQMQKASFDEPTIDFVCSGDGNYVPVVTNLQSGFSETWSNVDEELLILEFDAYATLDLTINSPYLSCSKDYVIDLPRFEGFVELNPVATSCGTCSDGYILVEIESQNCTSCEFEDYYIYREGDLNTDLKLLNSENNLEAGIYYVVAKSAEGCILNSSVVLIE